MTLQEALDIADEMKPNMMRRPLKIRYITEIEQLIHDEIIMQQEQQPEYTEETAPGTELLVPDPYSMLYAYWLMSKIDMQNQEDARYNIDRAQFEQAYDTFSDWYTRNYMPIQKIREFSI